LIKAHSPNFLHTLSSYKGSSAKHASVAIQISVLPAVNPFLRKKSSDLQPLQATILCFIAQICKALSSALVFQCSNSCSLNKANNPQTTKIIKLEIIREGRWTSLPIPLQPKTLTMTTTFTMPTSKERKLKVELAMQAIKERM
jgi:hypothetical protein